MSTYSTPFSIFSHTARSQILKALAREPHTVTDLAELVDLSMPEVSRHLGKLMEHKFVEKSAITRKYGITSFGKTSLMLFKPIDFLFNHEAFFQKHDLTGLPDIHQAQIHKLSDAEYVEGTGFVMLKMQELVEQTTERLRIMVDQPFPFGKGDIHVNYILPESFLVNNKDLKPDTSLKSVDARIHPRIPISIAIQDEETALLHFSGLDGKLDYAAGFYCDSDEGIEFVTQLWKYYWQSGEKPDFVQS